MQFLCSTVGTTICSCVVLFSCVFVLLCTSVSSQSVPCVVPPWAPSCSFWDRSIPVLQYALVCAPVRFSFACCVPVFDVMLYCGIPFGSLDSTLYHFAML